MDHFELVSEYSPTGDQPQAIEKLVEGFKDSGWPKIEVVRKEISDTPVSFQPLAVVGDIPGADFDLNDIPALADWIEAQMPAL